MAKSDLAKCDRQCWIDEELVQIAKEKLNIIIKSREETVPKGAKRKHPKLS